MITILKVSVLTVIVTAGLSAPAIAVDWRLQRATMSGVCVIGPVPPVPELGTVLATKTTRKAICELAKSVEGGDAGDSARCFTFTRFTVSECAKEKVVLKE